MSARLAEVADAYERQGVAVLRGALDAATVTEVAARCEAVWRRAVADPALAGRCYHRLDASGVRVADRLDPFTDLDPWLSAFADRPVIRGAVEALIGGSAWMLKDKVIFKRPGVDGYGPHQDHAYYRHTGIEADQIVSVLVPLAPYEPTAGPLEYVPGSHRELRLAPGTYDPDPAALAGASWQTLEAEPGDLAFLHPLAIHRSAPNRSSQSRPVAFVTFGSGPGRDEARAQLAAHYQVRIKALIDAGGTGEATSG